MGSPNNGPFNYVIGSLQLFTEVLNNHIEHSPIICSKSFKTKRDFSISIKEMPSTIQYEARKFEKRTSSSYTDFKFEIHENGLNLIKATKPGDVPGSFAEYVKILYKDGTIRAVYKDTTNNKGQKIHRHIKWPAKEI